MGTFTPSNRANSGQIPILVGRSRKLIAEIQAGRSPEEKANLRARHHHAGFAGGSSGALPDPAAGQTGLVSSKGSPSISFGREERAQVSIADLPAALQAVVEGCHRLEQPDRQLFPAGEILGPLFLLPEDARGLAG